MKDFRVVNYISQNGRYYWLPPENGEVKFKHVDSGQVMSLKGVTLVLMRKLMAFDSRIAEHVARQPRHCNHPYPLVIEGTCKACGKRVIPKRDPIPMVSILSEWWQLER